MSLLGCRLDTGRAKRAPAMIWPLLVVAGLLSIPAECARIGHPHSLFQDASASPASPSVASQATPHSAAAHDHQRTDDVPSWASPSGDLSSSPAPFASVRQTHPAHPHVGEFAVTPAAPPTLHAGDLPVVEPATATAIAAFGTALALIVALTVLLLPGRPRAAGFIAPLCGLLARALDPPPPRAQAGAS